MRRRAFIVLGLTLLVGLLGAAVAEAASDLYGNVGPGQSSAGLAGRYPLSHYSLDQQFDAVSASLTGGVDASGIPPMIAYFLASVLWQITAFLANAVITLFTFAFSLDLLNGSSETGGAGALEPVGQAIQGMYQHTFGQAWLVIAVLLAGCWAMWRALVQRRYAETAGALALSLVYCVIALAIVSQPAQTIGQVSKWTNAMSTAFLSVTTRGEVTTSANAKTQVANDLHRLLIYTPWVALNFGGTQHCIKTGTGSADHDPESVPVRPLPSATRRQLDAGHTTTTAGTTCIDNASRYAAHFLKYPDRSDERDAEYDAVNHGNAGKLPDDDKATGYRPGVQDKPITDAMEKGGQYQRLLLAIVIFVGELGVLCLLGTLSVSVILAQVLVLLLACFAPIALVLGVIPGRGHDYFRTWLTRLGSLLARKAVYSLVLAVLLALMAALQDASSGLGWLMAFGLQALLAWTVLLQRKQLAGRLTTAVSGPSDREEDGLKRVLSLYYGSRIVTQAARHVSRRRSRSDDHIPDNDQTDMSPVGTAAAVLTEPDGAEPTRSVGATDTCAPDATTDRTAATTPAPAQSDDVADGAGRANADEHGERDADPAADPPPQRSDPPDHLEAQPTPKDDDDAPPIGDARNTPTGDTAEDAPTDSPPPEDGGSLLDDLRSAHGNDAAGEEAQR